ncbi:hypothetical protein M2163_001169 [Streptomyces sp. SAI-135]|jgi:hypothetical protein|nr:hypothetical protein [Streptomyces sp. SAI-090]MDH6573204.1 hypothetical protein [Streptomyces sp. SAI-117]MDH6614061.1 hypothetical protein [Streptomyces sp. SAI-135]
MVRGPGDLCDVTAARPSINTPTALGTVGLIRAS